MSATGLSALRRPAQLYFRADTSVDPLPAIVTTHGPGWTADDLGRSGCDVIVAYKADKTNDKHPGWPGGRPRFGFVLKGGRRYDPRKDSTVGGSGAHRWEDRSTWEWSDNPAVCRYNWARGIYADGAVLDPSSLLVGRGLSAAEAPPANIFAPANLCDELVDGEPRYRVSGPIYANQEYLEVEQMFAIATGGSVVTREGSVELEPGASKSIVATITDADLVVGSKVVWNQAVLSEADPEWVNTVVARYVEPAQRWNDHAAPVVRSTADIVSDGKPREASITLRLVRYVNQALRVAEINRRLGRLWGRGQVQLGPRFCELEEGDWINWQSDRHFGGATITFRIEAYQLDAKWQNSLTLRQINAAVFGSAVFHDDQSVVVVRDPPIDIGSPDGGNWTLAAVLLSDAGVSVPALEITGAADDDDSVGAIVVEYWKDDGVINPLVDPDDPEWITEGSHAPTTTKVDITGIQGGADYFVAITYVVSGIYGDRLVLGPVTAGSPDISGAIDASASAPVTASEAIAAASFGNVYTSAGAARVRKANASDATKPCNCYVPAAIANGATVDVRGPGAKITGLAGLTPGTTYYLATVGGMITDTPPAGAGNLIQEIGVAVSATELLFNPKSGVQL
jgi:hypothetical protein